MAWVRFVSNQKINGMSNWVYLSMTWPDTTGPIDAARFIVGFLGMIEPHTTIYTVGFMEINEPHS